MKTSVSEKTVQKLKENNVEVIFEYPGGNIAPTLDSIKLDGNIDLVVTRNDQAASLMADAYSRANGKVGICMATLGPGATNLITGIANAYYDSIPMVVITGQTGKNSLKGLADTRQMGFQETDIVSVIEPVTKWSYLVKKPEDIGWVIDKAFRVAKEGRPGPVLIDIPIDLQRELLDEEEYLEETVHNTKINVAKNKIDILSKKIEEADRPVIIAGGGVILSEAEKELDMLSKRYNIPVANTLMGLGSYEPNSKLSLGFMGCYGSRFCNKSIANADLVIGIGNRFDVRSIGSEIDKFSKDRYIVHIDIDPSEINNRVKVDLGIRGDAQEVLASLIKQMKDLDIKNNTTEWIDEINSLRKGLDFDQEYGLKEEYEKVRPQYIINKIREITEGRGIFTADVGQNQMWLAQFMKFNKPRTHLTSGGLGNMGYGLPAAIGAKYANPEADVINVTGDGSFQMNIQELATAKEYKLPVKIFIMNNHTLGLVKQFQDKTFEGKATSTEKEYNPDFIKIAEGYDAVGFTIEKPEDIDTVVKKAMDIKDKTVVVNCIIDPDEIAIPELEGGHYLDDQYPYDRSGE